MNPSETAPMRAGQTSGGARPTARAPEGLLLCLALHRAQAALRLRLDHELGQHHGIDFDDFALVDLLATPATQALSVQALAAQLGLSRPAVLKRVLALEKCGLVQREGTSLGEGTATEAANGRGAAGAVQRCIRLRAPGRQLAGLARDTVQRVGEPAAAALAAGAQPLLEPTLRALGLLARSGAPAA